MLILSTNSEIDEYLYEKISPHVSNKYLISFDNEQQCYLERDIFLPEVRLCLKILIKLKFQSLRNIKLVTQE